jgi:hypothetical protein
VAEIICAGPMIDEIIWLEQGGPEVVAPTGPGGYGSKFVQRTLASTLGDSRSIDWQKSGFRRRCV